MRKTTLMAATEAAAPAACSDSTGPRNPTESSLSLSYADGGTYQAAGALVFVGGDLAASTFATAFPDSVGGYVISSFQQTGGTELGPPTTAAEASTRGHAPGAICGAQRERGADASEATRPAA